MSILYRSCHSIKVITLVHSNKMTSSFPQLASAPVQGTNPAASKMAEGIQARARLQLAGEGTIPVQETNPADNSKMVAGIQARASLQLAGEGVFSEPCVCCCRYNRSCPLHQETGQGCSLLVTPRETCELVTQQETGQGCSVLVTPRAICELGTQQGAARVLTASNSTLSVTSRNRGQGVCQDGDIVITGISNTRSCSSLDNTGAICGAAIQEVNPQATSMLVTGHESRLNSKK